MRHNSIQPEEVLLDMIQAIQSMKSIIQDTGEKTTWHEYVCVAICCGAEERKRERIS